MAKKELKIDTNSFEQVARVLAIINSSVVTYDRCLALMNSMVSECAQKSAYFGTAGFYIVCFDSEVNNTRTVTATLMPYVVEKYLKETRPTKSA